MIVCCRHGQHGERGTVSGSGQAGNIRGYHSQDKPAGPFTWNFRLDSSKVTELEVGRMREVVRPWLEMTNTGTGGYRGKTVLKDRLSITVEHPCDPNQWNKKKAVERFQGEVDKIVKEILTSEYDHLFHSQQSREDYAKQIGKVSFNSSRIQCIDTTYNFLK